MDGKIDPKKEGRNPFPFLLSYAFEVYEVKYTFGVYNVLTES